MALSSLMFRRCLATSAALNSAIKNVTVIGGGSMGSGIAQVTAQAGQNVMVVDVSQEALDRTKDLIHASVKRVAKKKFSGDEKASEEFINKVIGNIKISTDHEESSKNADLVIEAIVENLVIKQKLFADLDKVASQSTIFASNTSSLRIEEIASFTQRKDRFGGLHFFNPVPVMKLLEVIRIPDTSEETYQKMMEWGKSIGKVTITCKDTPGFVVNKILRTIFTEGIGMVERGDASVRDIDTGMKLGAGHPMGPLELADYVGLDVIYNVSKGYHERYPDDPRYKPSELIERMVKEGKLGVKSGEGFYKYDKK